LRKEEYELAKKLAGVRGVSVSRVIGDALRTVDNEEPYVDPLAHLIGRVKGTHPQASERHDEVIYGADVR
jgi:hypothetical protein